MQDDPETQVSFPSQVNLCHHLKNPGRVNLEYQRIFCQSGQHPYCEIFPEGRYTQLPGRARIDATQRAVIRRPWLLTALIVLALLVIGVAGLTLLDPDLLPFSLQPLLPAGETLLAPPVTDRPSSASPSSPATSDEFTSTADIPVAPIVSAPSTTTVLDATLVTATYVPIGLETPIGTNPSLLIHRVLPGESLDLIAARFDTSVEAIQAINYYLPSPLWADLPLVVPLGQQATAGLPQFEAYQVSASGITVEQFAQGLDLDVRLLRKYNLLPEGARLVAGQWLLIPRPSE
jgi:LysM repeat protein